ncbi:universal stress protein [Variovorax ginsengisoli]|uniref:Universal stress protein n=1 Tax=Variovorax ginsengisoli TaxID=363844 RepID=A0ABT8RW01_9BURK|nr:universal stress protein [Variovorax ginsengisoli]MDN8611589.1 universal stress protein [Variovorax ginsengisoli]MDO1530759.1 universal stress protein [Variovorax ginsengisoli]
MYQRILVPVDGSATSMCGLDEAIRVAKLTDGQVRLLYVIDELSFALAMGSESAYASDAVNTMRSEAKRILDAALATAKSAGVEADTRFRDTFPSSLQDQVAAEARDWGADLIVLGTHGRRGAKRLLLGSGAERILRLAPVPVLLVRPPDEKDAAADLLRASASVVALAGK